LKKLPLIHFLLDKGLKIWQNLETLMGRVFLFIASEKFAFACASGMQRLHRKPEARQAFNLEIVDFIMNLFNKLNGLIFAF